MTTAQITLTQTESEALKAMSQITGKTEEQLLREVVERFLAQSEHQKRRLLLQQAKGIWKDRNDLPALEELRAELDHADNSSRSVPKM